MWGPAQESVLVMGGNTAQPIGIRAQVGVSQKASRERCLPVLFFENETKKRKETKENQQKKKNGRKRKKTEENGRKRKNVKTEKKKTKQKTEKKNTHKKIGSDTVLATLFAEP